MEVINDLSKIMQMVRRGRDPSSFQTLTMAQQGLAMLFCAVTSCTPRLWFVVHSTATSCTNL